MDHTDLRMAGSELGIDLTDPQDESPSSDSHQAAVICPFPGLPANRCCRSYPCRRLPHGAEQPLPGLGISLA
jgi:hypothetical protein